ncbi:Transcriptional regulator of rhamnose utilization, DeoR family [Candidatus Burkholderia verschuerenii]|uniref:Transcriptional regulator of rhamnose utilization, DeoR family n=1 Tax=Candidatus Burkholderia verschuerenii TaxID=242163 RepID=A0A0L0MDW9_9BURK|nr:DeoR/GlpR family DNA-binding transcription regulator [Candidatus Burkholderia verschuerenii]KND60491.1 Transcriptional regulator of rhamnose utilization, DeoR family [Candidatus Burkholderia verschuerenii]
MLTNKNSLKRRLQIVELVRKRGEVSVEELSQAFDVSSVTIRSDLTYLEQQRYLLRSFGKARYLAQKSGEDILVPASDGAARKSSETLIARIAAESVGDHEAVMLGAGEIIHKIVPFLADRANLSLLVQDIAIAHTAQRFLHCELLLTGGQLENGGTAMSGPDAEASVARRQIDVCLLQASGLDRDGNLLAADPALARVAHAAARAATRTIVLAYQPLLDERSGKVFASAADVDMLLIDDGIDPPTIDTMARHGLTLERREGGVVEFRRD